MTVSTGQDHRTIPVDHPSLGNGWWAVETQDGSLGRWTDGDAAIGDLAGGAVLTVDLAARAPFYPTEASVAARLAA